MCCGGPMLMHMMKCVWEMQGSPEKDDWKGDCYE